VQTGKELYVRAVIFFAVFPSVLFLTQATVLPTRFFHANTAVKTRVRPRGIPAGFMTHHAGGRLDSVEPHEGFLDQRTAAILSGTSDTGHGDIGHAAEETTLALLCGED
jgi:hypothetical protein